MATRFYFPITEAAAVSPTISAEWEHQATGRRKLLTTPDASALTNFTFAPDAADHLVDNDSHNRQYISDPLTAQTIPANIVLKAQFQCFESNAANNLFLTIKVFVVSNDGSTIKETLLTITRDNVEMDTALTNRQFTATMTGSVVTIEDGDRLVVEVGAGGLPTASGGVQGHNETVRWGCSASSGDLPENNTEIGMTFRPWLEIAETIFFQADARRAQVSWAEAEIPFAPRRAQFSWNELEVPSVTADRRGQLSWAELELPLAPRRGRLSWNELDVPLAPRRGRLSWAEAEVPTAPRKGQLSWMELDIPLAPRRGRLSWNELELPLANNRGRIGWVELESLSGPRRGRLSWTELEAPSAAERRGQLSWAELELALSPRRGRLSWAELEVLTAPRRGRISWAELQLPTSGIAARISQAYFQVPNRTGTVFEYVRLVFGLEGDRLQLLPLDHPTLYICIDTNLLWAFDPEDLVWRQL